MGGVGGHDIVYQANNHSIFGGKIVNEQAWIDFHPFGYFANRGSFKPLLNNDFIEMRKDFLPSDFCFTFSSHVWNEANYMMIPLYFSLV